MNTREHAFTLMELIVVIGVVVILALFPFPHPGINSTRAQQIKAMSNARQIGIVFKSYALDYGGKFPIWIDPELKK